MFVVVMFEPALPSEVLTLSEQVNGVFGPFSTEAQVDRWAERAVEIIKDRQWLIIPLSDPAMLNAIDPKVN
jgi:hypothetical protein